MTFLIIVLMYAMNPSTGQQIYIFTQPTFTTFEDCKLFVESYNNFIYDKAIIAYQHRLQPKEIYCVDKEVVPELLKPQGESI